eukprot:g39550.t1
MSHLEILTEGHERKRLLDEEQHASYLRNAMSGSAFSMKSSSALVKTLVDCCSSSRSNPMILFSSQQFPAILEGKKRRLVSVARACPLPQHFLHSHLLPSLVPSKFGVL